MNVGSVLHDAGGLLLSHGRCWGMEGEVRVIYNMDQFAVHVVRLKRWKHLQKSSFWLFVCSERASGFVPLAK